MSYDDRIIYFLQILETKTLLYFFNHPVHCDLSEDIQQSCLTITDVGM